MAEKPALGDADVTGGPLGSRGHLCGRAKASGRAALVLTLGAVVGSRGLTGFRFRESVLRCRSSEPAAVPLSGLSGSREPSFCCGIVREGGGGGALARGRRSLGRALGFAGRGGLDELKLRAGVPGSAEIWL